MLQQVFALNYVKKIAELWVYVAEEWYQYRTYYVHNMGPPTPDIRPFGSITW